MNELEYNLYFLLNLHAKIYYCKSEMPNLLFLEKNTFGGKT